jgi:hypothetical protein
MRLAALFYVALAGCSSVSGSGFRNDAAAPAGDNDGGDLGAESDGGLIGDGATSADAGQKVGEVYAHSASTLYKLEPFSKNTVIIGAFKNCAGSVIDLALDATGQMYATTSGSLERVDKSTATCTTVARGSYPNSLTFVPLGTLDPNDEALVGFEGASYVRIDLKTGNKSQVGSLNPNSLGATFTSSGDVVSIIGDKTYLTAKASPAATGDVLIEVDPQTGKALRRIGDTGVDDLFGLGYWAGTAYAFSNAGKIFAVDLSNGKTTPVPIPNAPAQLSFWGAGVTTAAPLEPPR